MLFASPPNPRKFLAGVGLLLFPVQLLAPAPVYEYPILTKIHSLKDPIYRQLQEDIVYFYRGKTPPAPLLFYRYVPKEGETIFTLSAQLNLPYETIATLNRWQSPKDMHVGEVIYLPNTPGLFLFPKGKGSDLEKRLLKKREPHLKEFRRVSFGGGTVAFLPGELFDKTERALFLALNFFFNPLRVVTVTSPYGPRIHPITKNSSWHAGIDMRAKLGTPVLASQAGVVSEIGTLYSLGNYLIIDHPGGSYQTVYGHLKEAKVKVGQQVTAGSVVALSGKSGFSTGPHLHFEIRKNGRDVDPYPLLEK